MKILQYIIFLSTLAISILNAQPLKVLFSDVDPRLNLEPSTQAMCFTGDGCVYFYNPEAFPQWSEGGVFSFGKFFWEEDQLLKLSPDAYAKKHSKRLSRSVSDRVKLYFPVPSDMLYAKVELKWLQFKNTENYHVYVTDRFNHVLMRKATADTFMIVDFSEYNANKGVCYFWFVEPDQNKEERSDEICLTWIEDHVRDRIFEELERIKSISGQYPLQTYILKAGLFEQHKLYIEALKEYKQAIELYPDSDDIKRMYAMYLVRIGVIKSVQEIYN